MNRLLLLAGMVCLPLRHLSLSSPFGYRMHPLTRTYAFHAGVDLRARSDTVFAILDGKVLAAEYHPFLGVYIRLGHQNFQSTYGHLSRIFVLPGDSVVAGSPIGITGATGRTTGEHLHFSIQFRTQYIDPLKFLTDIQDNLKSTNKEKNQ
jgi:murein DD-endopeptidase MepM/ murein hydrolase activator NlpD